MAVRPLHTRDDMRVVRHIFVLLILALPPAAAAQTPAAEPPKPPPPLWDVQIGASFVGTSGNTDTSSVGADFAAHRRGYVWQIESTATAVRVATSDVTTAERYLGQVQLKRKLTPIIGLTAGEKLERDQFAGIDLRSILNGGLSWALVHTPAWTLDGLTAAGWQHEERTTGPGIDDAVGVLQLPSRIPFGGAGDTTQRVTFYPDFTNSSAYRTEAEVTAQAAMNAHLALKIGYLLRYSNEPVPTFKKTDNTTTASVVLRWKASTPAPPQ
jgi:putative salt-induced outer membrane protein